MCHESIQSRTAAVRKSWTYGERLQRVMAAQLRCQRLLQQLGLVEPKRRVAYATRPVSAHCGRLSG